MIGGLALIVGALSEPVAHGAPPATDVPRDVEPHVEPHDGALATAPEMPPADLSSALALVDWLGWAASDREVDQYLTEARSDAGLYARSLRESDRSRLRYAEMPALYAVEATLADVRIATRQHVLVQIREAIVYENPASVALEGVALRLFANGQDHRAHGADVQGVWVDNQPARFSIDGTILSVELPAPLPPGHRTRILLHLIEEVPTFDPVAPIGDGALSPEGIGAYGRADGWINLGYWLPIITPTDRRGRFDIRPLRSNTEHAMFDPALFHVVLNTPSAFSLASTGVEIHRTSEGDQATTIAVAGLARDFAVSLLPAASTLQAEVAGTRIRVLHPSDDPVMGQHLLEYAERAMRVYTERFGPISAAEIDVVEAPIRGVVGVEYPGLVSVDVSHQRIPYHRSAAHEWAVAHEVAHQWWSCEVGSDPAMFPWLDEALAANSASLYWLDRYGQDALDARMMIDVTRRTRRLHDQGRPDLPANLPAWKYDLNQYAAIVYGRGSMFFDRVRLEVGDQRYFDALGRYHERFHGRFATPLDLMDALTSAADDPERIEALYTRWIAEAHGYEDLLELDPVPVGPE